MMKSFLFAAAGLLGLVIVVLLVGCALSVSLRVIAAFRARSDEEAGLVAPPVAGAAPVRALAPAPPAVLKRVKRE